jgi:hypothetical protein
MQERLGRIDLSSAGLAAWTGTRREFVGNTVGLASTLSSVPPFINASIDTAEQRASQVEDIVESVLHPSASREIHEYIGGRPEATIETHPDIFTVNKVEWGELEPIGEEGIIAEGIISSNGQSFVGIELEGMEDPLYSSPFFSVIVNGRVIHAGIPQGPQSNKTQVALGFLPEGESDVHVLHTSQSDFLNQDNPLVKIFELEAEHPLMREFVLPSLPAIGEKTYSDFPLQLGFREDAPIGSDLHLFLDDEECVQVLNGINLKERVGDPHKILAGRRSRHEYLSSCDIDAKQVGKAAIEDGRCKELGYQRDTYFLGQKFLSHRVYIDKHFSPSQHLRALPRFKNSLQEVGFHGMLTRIGSPSTSYTYMPEFSGYNWRDSGWNRAAGITNLRQLLFTGAINLDDEIIQEFVERELGGEDELITNNNFWMR